MNRTRLIAAALLVLVTICWGGGTTRLAQGCVLAALGALFLFAPATHRPPRWFAWLAFAWLALAACAFLPAAWFPTPAWRERLSEAGVVFPTTLTPQPALTTEAFIWLFAGLAWLGWLSPDFASRKTVMRLLAIGISAIGLFALAAWEIHWRVPGWLSERGFGPFPNRNHTGHVLALGGMLVLGCAVDAARRKIIHAWPWVLALGLIGCALVMNYSRGGVLLFFGSATLWAGIAAWQCRSWKVATLAASALLASWAFVLLSSHAMAARFAGGENSDVSFRTLIWRDTLAMISDSPWCGDGLGNFRGIFPFYREASVIQQAVWHPESDWLQLAVENSWFAVALALGIFGVFALRAFPLKPGTHQRLRGAALAGAIGAALHGLIDVPAHRAGSALLALMLLALAQHDTVPGTLPRMVWMWRAAGLALIGAAALWFRVPDHLAQTTVLADARDFAGAKAAADRAIARAPLAWQGYYVRAAVAANEGRVLSAVADFRRARILEPHNLKVPLREAEVWLNIAPVLALPAWEDALRRVPPQESVQLFTGMLAAAPNNPAFRARLLTLTEGRPELRRLWLEKAPPEERAAAKP
jgi:O-antigen ligase